MIAVVAYSSVLIPMTLVAIVPLVLTIVARRTPAVAAVPRRRALITWAGALIAISAVGSPLAVVSFPGVFVPVTLCAAIALTLVAVELICTALTRPEDAEALPPW